MRRPRTIQEKLNADVVNALAAPDLRRKLQEQGMVPQPTSLDQFAAYLRNDIAKYAKVVKSSGIKIDF